MRTRKLLLTGGTGMVGQNIQEHPDIVQWEVLAPGSRQLDLTNYSETLAYFSHHRPDYVVHAAGQVGGIQANMASPVAFLVANTDMGRNVILAAREAGVSRLINLASSCMYPRGASNPLEERLLLTGELEPTNEGYALSKIFSTRLCEYINRESKTVRYKTLIPCNLFGRHDKFEPHHSHLIPALIHKLHLAKVEGASEVEVWGDGTARREFMYAGDLADVVLRSLGAFETLPDLMNVGPGFDYSINEYYEMVARVVGWRGHFRHDLSKPVGMKQKLVNVDRQHAWGWSPNTSLVAGIEKAYEYYLQKVYL
jgi:GDP-L-fucose synthase